MNAYEFQADFRSRCPKGHWQDIKTDEEFWSYAAELVGKMQAAIIKRENERAKLIEEKELLMEELKQRDDEIEDITAENRALTLQVLNLSGLDEQVRRLTAIADKLSAPVISANDITVENTAPIIPAPTAKEDKPKEKKPSPQALAKSFESFWTDYPKKRAKQDALKVWKSIAPTKELAAKITAALAEQKATEDWQREGGKFIPYPATWLRGGQWEDEVSASLPEAVKPVPVKEEFADTRKHSYDLDAIINAATANVPTIEVNGND